MTFYTFTPRKERFATKYIFQFARILAFCFLGEILHCVLPLPVPASVYGLVLLLLFFMPWYISWNALRSSKRSNDGVIPETRIAVNEDRIDVDEGCVHFTLEYRKFCRVVHLKHSYVLMIGRRSGLMIDPDGFTRGTFTEFKQFLREKRPDLNIPE